MIWGFYNVSEGTELYFHLACVKGTDDEKPKKNDILFFSVETH